VPPPVTTAVVLGSYEGWVLLSSHETSFDLGIGGAARAQDYQVHMSSNRSVPVKNTFG
jgi:hypothetical protein